jgi:hypothetical protein
MAVDAEMPARNQLLRADGAVCFFKLGEDLGTAAIIFPADLGEADLAGGTVQQPGAEVLFKRLDVVAHHRRRHTEATRRGTKAAAFDDPNEGSEAAQAIHFA